MKKVLVTGAAGFIGSHLCEALLAKGIEVIGIDCFTDYYPRAIKEKNLSSFRNNPNFKFIEDNLLKVDLNYPLSGVDTVFHLAAQPGVRYSWENFQVYLENNIHATQKLLEACKEKKPQFVFASSSSVYGNAPLPITENVATMPISPYGLTKVSGENLCKLYAHEFKIPTIVLRYFTVYGPRQRPDMAIYKFFNSIINGKEVEVYGDGNQTRDMTYVSDIVDATILAGEFETDYLVFNIGSGIRTQLKEVIRTIEVLTGKKAKINYKPAAKGDMKDTWAEIGKAKAYLNYEPKIKLEEGLGKYLEWYMLSRASLTPFEMGDK